MFVVKDSRGHPVFNAGSLILLEEYLKDRFIASASGGISARIDAATQWEEQLGNFNVSTSLLTMFGTEFALSPPGGGFIHISLQGAEPLYEVTRDGVSIFAGPNKNEAVTKLALDTLQTMGYDRDTQIKIADRIFKDDEDFTIKTETHIWRLTKND